MKNFLQKRSGKILSGLLICVMLVVIGVCVYPALAAPGQSVEQNTIPLARDKATAPYAVFQVWGGTDNKKCFDTSDDTLKLGATYTNVAVRFEQDAVTKVWYCTPPSLLPSRRYVTPIRDGAAGAEANTDVEVGTIVLDWDKVKGAFRVVENDVFVSY